MEDPSNEASVQVRKLQVNYGSLEALKEISFSLHPGSITGFLGPNGAGKSTTMRCLVGCNRNYSGDIRICGEDIQLGGRDAQSRIGYLPEAASGFNELTVEDFLRFCADIRLERSRAIESVKEICTQLNLNAVLHASLGELSKGWRQRAWLAQALLHDPDILILDEPTDGLDPLQKQAVRDFICQGSSSKTVLISTHILEEAEAICDRSIIISDGQIVADCSTQELLDANGRLFSRYEELVNTNS